MSNPIVEALELAAARIGKSLSEDAGKAVESMYRDAGKGLEDVVKRIQNADDEAAHKLLDAAERVGKEDAGRVARDEAPTGADSFARQKLRALLEVSGLPTVRRRLRRERRTTGICWTGSLPGCRRSPRTR